MEEHGKKNQEGEALKILAEDSLQNETRKDQYRHNLRLGLDSSEEATIQEFYNIDMQTKKLEIMVRPRT